MTFGEKLLMLRKRGNFSQEELAEKLGVSRQAVSRWESGETMPDSPNLLQISNIFAVSADYLLRNEIEEPSGEPKNKKSEQPKKRTLFLFYIFGLLAMSVLLYGIALSDMDIVYWLGGTVFLIAGIISALIYFKKPDVKMKSPLYLAAAIIFLIAAVLGFCSGTNAGIIMGIGNLAIAVILFLIYGLK